MSRWFICVAEQVTGPFTSDEIKAQVANGQSGQECLIWGRPNIQWLSYGAWSQSLDNILTKPAPIATVSRPFEPSNRAQATETVARHVVELADSEATARVQEFQAKSQRPAVSEAQAAAEPEVQSQAGAPSQSQPMTTTAAATAATTTIAASNQQWHFAVEGVSKGPFNRTDLIKELRALQNRDEILVWTKGMKAWTDIYEFHDFVDELGLNRREHPRAPIQGTIVTTVNGQALTGQLKSISLGGLGATQLSAILSIGEVLNVELSSPTWSEKVFAKAVVQYISELGYIGMRFQSMSEEAKTIILEYVVRTKERGQNKIAA